MIKHQQFFNLILNKFDKKTYCKIIYRSYVRKAVDKFCTIELERGNELGKFPETKTVRSRFAQKFQWGGFT